MELCLGATCGARRGARWAGPDDFSQSTFGESVPGCVRSRSLRPARAFRDRAPFAPRGPEPAEGEEEAGQLVPGAPGPAPKAAAARPGPCPRPWGLRSGGGTWDPAPAHPVRFPVPAPPLTALHLAAFLGGGRVPHDWGDGKKGSGSEEGGWGRLGRSTS